MLRQDLNDTTTLGTGSDIPLEVAGGVAEGSVELVGDELIGGEDAEGVLVSGKRRSGTDRRTESKREDVLLDGVVEDLTNGLHAGSLGALLVRQRLPVGDVEGDVSGVGLTLLAELEGVLLRDDGEDVVVGDTVVAEELAGTVRQEPILELLALSGVGLGGGKRDLVGAEGTLNELAVDDLGASPTL